MKNSRDRPPQPIYLPEQMIEARINEAGDPGGIWIAGGGGDGPQQTLVMMVPSHQIDRIIGPGVLLTATVVLHICGT